MSVAAPAGTLTVTPVAGRIGADIAGVDLAADLDSETVETIHDALAEHKVLFFRGQALDHAAHIALARRFGRPTNGQPHRPAGSGPYPEIHVVDPEPDEAQYGRGYEERMRRHRASYRAGWHTDASPAVNPPAAAILRAEQVPPFGGDTQWTNLVAAYEGMSEPLRAFADSLTAEHWFLAGFDIREHDPEAGDLARQLTAAPIISVHPVVRVIPETAEHALFVNPSSTGRIVGLSAVESRRVLDLFYEQITRDEYTVRFRWEPGSVAFWDNRTTAHLAALDNAHIDSRRRLYRVSLLGEKPMGPTGFVSRSIAGEPILAAEADPADTYSGQVAP